MPGQGPLPGHSLKLTYRIRPEDQRAHHWFEWGHRFPDRARHHYAEMSFWWGLLLLGAFAGYKAESLFISCVFVVALVISVRRSVPYSKVYWQEVEGGFGPCPEHNWTLAFEREGFGFSWKGRGTFAPWSAVEGYAIREGRLFLRIEDEGWTCVPMDTLEGGEESFARLQAYLDEVGIGPWLDPSESIETRAGG